MTGADAKRPQARLLIIPHDRLPEEASTEKTEEGGEQSIIVSPSHSGIVAIRAPLRGESFRAQAMEELRKARVRNRGALGAGGRGGRAGTRPAAAGRAGPPATAATTAQAVCVPVLAISGAANALACFSRRVRRSHRCIAEAFTQVTPCPGLGCDGEVRNRAQNIRRAGHGDVHVAPGHAGQSSPLFPVSSLHGRFTAAAGATENTVQPWPYFLNPPRRID